MELNFAGETCRRKTVTPRLNYVDGEYLALWLFVISLNYSHIVSHTYLG